MSAVGRGLLSLMIVLALMSGVARPEDLDQGKSGAKLFAANCAHCHRSPRGLAKDRFSWTLSRFLQQHYTNGSASAETLTAFHSRPILAPDLSLPCATRDQRGRAHRSRCYVRQRRYQSARYGHPGPVAWHETVYR